MESPLPIADDIHDTACRPGRGVAPGFRDREPARENPRGVRRRHRDPASHGLARRPSQSNQGECLPAYPKSDTPRGQWATNSGIQLPPDMRALFTRCRSRVVGRRTRRAVDSTAAIRSPSEATSRAPAPGAPRASATRNRPARSFGCWTWRTLSDECPGIRCMVVTIHTSHWLNGRPLQAVSRPRGGVWGPGGGRIICRAIRPPPCGYVCEVQVCEGAGLTIKGRDIDAVEKAKHPNLFVACRGACGTFAGRR
jgi:hypothetical protein